MPRFRWGGPPCEGRTDSPELFRRRRLFHIGKRSIEKFIAHYTSITHQPQNNLKEDGSRVLDPKKRALLDVWLGWIAVPHNLHGAFDEKLKVPRSKVKFYWQESIVSRSMDTMISKLVLLKAPLNSLRFQLWKGKCLFLRVHASNCMLSTVQLRSARSSSKEVCYYSSILSNFRAEPAAACNSRIRREILFALSWLLYLVLCIS